MNNAYLFAVMLLVAPLAGCIELDDSVDDSSSSSLEDAFNDFINSINTGNWRTYCKYIAYTVDDETNTIILVNNTELDECAEDSEGDNDNEYKFTISNYIEENLDYRAANNSGFVYSVNFTVEECEREDGFEPWDCDNPQDESILWVEVGGQWLFWHSIPEQGESAPIVTFFVEEGSDGIYHVDVIKVTRQEALAGFSFYLKDETGSTYVGGSNGFGEIAMQIVAGEEHGIDVSYNGSDETLQNRVDTISADDGSDFPVHFSDNDSDGMLSAGDQFKVYGSGDSANGPASDNWRLVIQFDSTGDIVGSATMQ